jgi:hypothetical protein
MIKRLWKWLRKNVLNKNMLFWFLIAELIFWSPCIATAIMAIYNPYWWTVFGAICAFWAGPFTPAVPLQLGLATLLKKIFSKREKEESNDDV